MDQKSQNIVLINNSRTTWHTYISILELLGQLTMMHIFQKGVDNFEIERKSC